MCKHSSTLMGQARRLPYFGICLVAALSGSLGGRATAAGTPPPSAEDKERQQKILFYAQAMRDSLNATKNDEGDDSKKITYQISKDGLWYHLVDLQAAGGDFAGATDTADAHRQTDDEGFAYSSIVEAQAEAGDVAGAKESAKHYRVTEPIIKENLPAVIALAEARAGDWKAVKAMLTPPPPPGDEDSPAGGLFDALVNGVLAGHAQETALLNQILAMVPDAKGETWRDLQSLWALQATGWVRAGKLDQARAALAKITDPFFRGWLLRNLALQQAGAGDRQGARETLAPARALVDAQYNHNLANANGKKPDENDLDAVQGAYYQQLGYLADAEVLIGDAGGAKKTLETLKEDKEQDSYSPALAELAVRQAKAGDLAGAEETARSNPDINERAKSLGLVAQAQIKQGHPEAARREVEEAEHLLQANKDRNGTFSNANPSAHPVALALAQLDGVEAGVHYAEQMDTDNTGVRTIRSTEDIAAMIARRQTPAEAQKWVEKQTNDPHVRAMYYRVMGEAVAATPSTPYGLDVE